MKLFFFYFFFSLFLIFLDSKGIISPLRGLTQTLTVPFNLLLFELKTAAASPLRFILEDSQAGERVSKLEEKVSRLTAENARVKALQQENERLRQLLGSPLAPSWKFTPGRVITQQGDFLIVTSAATNASIAKGTPVIVSADGGGILVGKVHQVLGHELKIMLPSHPEARIPSFVRGKDGAKTASGIVVGEARTASLEQVLTSEKLQNDYPVFTTGEAGFPADLLIGEITEISGEEGRAWQKAKLRLSLRDLPEYVFFVTEY